MLCAVLQAPLPVACCFCDGRARHGAAVFRGVSVCTEYGGMKCCFLILRQFHILLVQPGMCAHVLLWLATEDNCRNAGLVLSVGAGLVVRGRLPQAADGHDGFAQGTLVRAQHAKYSREDDVQCVRVSAPVSPVSWYPCPSAASPSQKRRPSAELEREAHT